LQLQLGHSCTEFRLCRLGYLVARLGSNSELKDLSHWLAQTLNRWWHAGFESCTQQEENNIWHDGFHPV